MFLLTFLLWLWLNFSLWCSLWKYLAVFFLQYWECLVHQGLQCLGFNLFCCCRSVKTQSNVQYCSQLSAQSWLTRPTQLTLGLLRLCLIKSSLNNIGNYPGLFWLCPIFLPTEWLGWEWFEFCVTHLFPCSSPSLTFWGPSTSLS